MSEQWLEVTLPVPAGELDRVCDVRTANGTTCHMTVCAACIKAGRVTKA